MRGIHFSRAAAVVGPGDFQVARQLFCLCDVLGRGQRVVAPFSPPRTPPLFSIALAFRGEKRISQGTIKGEGSRYREAGAGQIPAPTPLPFCWRCAASISAAREETRHHARRGDQRTGRHPDRPRARPVLAGIRHLQ